jgi:hypothetical protein
MEWRVKLRRLEVWHALSVYRQICRHADKFVGIPTDPIDKGVSFRVPRNRTIDQLD